MPEVVDKVQAVLADALAEQGFDLWDVKYEKQDSDMVLRVLVDRLDGDINMDDLVMLTEFISNHVDAIQPDPFPEAYLLDVSSPGAERELKRDRHYNWALNKTIAVALKTPIDHANELSGTLIDKTATELILEVVGKKGKRTQVTVPIDQIKQTHLSIDQDRILTSDADFEWALEKFVRVSTYRKIDGQKEFVGELVGFTPEALTIEDEDEQQVTIQRDIIAKASHTNTF
ncbi:ribosome maturation factor [Weissella minor]|uniref:ribosome maturation factor n=1 Tax=Weissella minor TaxID=1620 RepID=UPI001BAF716E|nr:ribosome maturation factor [Weissella minor]MBS0949322.1 ribosome maturation factor [Weissella minor]